MITRAHHSTFNLQKLFNFIKLNTYMLKLDILLGNKNPAVRQSEV